MARRALVALVCLVSPLLIAQESTPAKPKLPHISLLGGTTVVATCTDEKLQPVTPNPAGQPFKDPPSYSAGANGQLTLNLDVRQYTRAVPVLNAKGQCIVRNFDLRMFGAGPPSDPSGYTYPAPTLILRKPYTNAQGQPMPGDRFTINLTNNLPKSNENCTQKNGPPCDCSGPVKPQCCAISGQQPPNCFHGDNTTNLHFHGLHVSPQSPQDYVLLELQPWGTPPSDDHAASHGVMGTKAIGSFSYSVNPLPANQSPGTHWYHPHKHGSTALQVGNGMAGAILVRGEFDDEINSYYPNGLTEHVMMLQLVHDLNFTEAKHTNSLPLINGQLQPVVQMRPGEIQRWRMVGATMEGNAQLTIDFDSPQNTGLTAMQIAMDGIRFSNTNYQCQPLLNTSATPPCTGVPATGVTNPNFNISPGNRADFLVRAPSKPGRYAATFEVFGHTDPQGDNRPQRSRPGRGLRQPTVANIKEVLELFAPGAAQPALLIVEVTECADPAQCPTMQFPPALSKMPEYLTDIPATSGTPLSVQFRLDATPGTPGAPAVQPQTFGIAVQGQNGGKIMQFDASCANFSQALGSTATWSLSQNVNSGGAPFHVFHIHTNPFQVVRFGSQTYPEPIWMDSITLPNNANGPADGFPTDTASTVLIRQQFEDYTGAYVLHCHFLGHEDRGMMLMVQTTCPNATGYYGKPQANGGPDDCSICVTNPAACTAALTPCGSTSSATTTRTRKAKH